MVSWPVQEVTWYRENKSFLVSSYTDGVKSKREFPLGTHTLLKHLFVREGRQKHTQTQTLAYTDMRSIPKLLCVGETGLGDRFGELVSMLWVIW